MFIDSNEQLASTNDRVQASSAFGSLCFYPTRFIALTLNEAIFEKFHPLYKPTHSANGPSGRTRRKRIIPRSQPRGTPLSSSQCTQSVELSESVWWNVATAVWDYEETTGDHGDRGQCSWVSVLEVSVLVKRQALQTAS